MARYCAKCKKKLGFLENFGSDDAPLCFECNKISTTTEHEAQENSSSTPDTINLEMFSKEFWSFDDLITVRVIPIVFKIVLVINAIVSIFVAIIQGIDIYQLLIGMGNSKDFCTTLVIVESLIFIAIYNIITGISARLIFEVLIVVFKIWENTKLGFKNVPGNEKGDNLLDTSNEESETYFYCTDCKAEVSIDDKFCKKCGADVSNIEKN